LLLHLIILVDKVTRRTAGIGDSVV